SQLRFTWQGREYSYATGLYSFRARWYDPAAGRWLSKDPIGLEGGLNLYEAFGSNPVCFRDPTGKILPLFTGIINGVIGGVIGAICNGVQGKGVLKGALVGAIGGFVTGITFGIAAPAVASCGAGIVIAGGVSGAVGSAASSITDEIISSLNGTDEHCFDWGRVGVAIRNGAITGLGIGVVGAWGGRH
ncbi:MAG: hypothetical protein IJR99_07605, partial [Kiritimatiellae bacterium]|nr:hypothetical protein [Kiritimatiellia bacterium]